jgi:ascorbate-specific PTS system EIIC-type component UlaA
VATVGFFGGSVIGVLGIVVLLLWKTSRALSYGPWIAIGGLVCMLFYGAFVRFFRPAADMVGSMIQGVQ